MSDKTSIEWTDATWNPITGCSVVSPGCTNCYAMKLAGGRLQHHHTREGLTNPSKAGPVWNGQVRFNKDQLALPLRWTRPRRIFVCAHGDLFHESVPDEWIDRVFAVMALCSQHTFQVLTKRPERMRAYFVALAKLAASRDEEPGLCPQRLDRFAVAVSGSPCAAGALEEVPWPLANVWLGVSAEDQARADERIPVLLDTPAAVRFLSAEPLLGPICIFNAGVKINGKLDRQSGERRSLDWVIVGGESGPGARPMHPDWARQIRDDCANAGVAFHFKQWGSWLPHNQTPWNHRGAHTAVTYGKASILDEFGDALYWNAGKKAAGRLLDGVTHDGFPEEARSDPRT